MNVPRMLVINPETIWFNDIMAIVISLNMIMMIQ